jgi:penicillin-binding protein 1A
MANAYATLASGGMRNKPIAILRVKFPDGEVEELGKPKRERVLSDAQAHEVTKILKQNVTSGTGTRSQIGCPSAGKTGTTDNFNDAWFDGYTPHLATAVWVGYPDALREMRSVHGISVAGGTFPAEIWKKFMDVAKGKNCSDFPVPKSRISWSPFFGRYSKGGSGYSYSSGDGYDYGNTTGGGYQGYDPRLYDQPGGEAPPDDQQPGSAPGNDAPGNGNGNQDGGAGLGGDGGR